MADTHHFFIVASNDDDESLDLAVEAGSPDEAVSLWRDWLTSIGEDLVEYDHVLKVPALTGNARILEWHDLDGMEKVL